jgi:hypothetical protein
MSEDGVIFLPENVVQDLAGRRLPQGGTPMEFEYCGKRYRARQRDPSQLEGEIQCELIQEPVQKKPVQKKKEQLKRPGRGRRIAR